MTNSCYRASQFVYIVYFGKSVDFFISESCNKKENGLIIYLNGVSSSGKTTLTQALQKKLPEPYYWLANDTFVDMSPDKLRETDWYEAEYQALTMLHNTVKLFSDMGKNVIIDQPTSSFFIHTRADTKRMQYRNHIIFHYRRNIIFTVGAWNSDGFQLAFNYYSKIIFTSPNPLPPLGIERG